MAQMNMRQMCPATLPGTEISTLNTSTGIAVTFTASSGNVAELQKRVEQMANMQERMADSTNMKDMPMGTPTAQSMLAGDVTYEVLAKGARLTFKPKDQTKLEEFRKQIESRVEMMKKGDCTMMGNMMGNMMHRADEPHTH